MSRYRTTDPRTPATWGVAGFLPGHVLTGQDEGRLLDLLDVAHFAAVLPGRAVGYSHLARIHPMKERVQHGGFQRGHAFANYGKWIERLVAFARLMGMTVGTDRRGEGGTLRVLVPDPHAVKERATELLDELEIRRLEKGQSDEEAPRVTQAA